MDNINRLKSAGLFSSNVPRYTSYPTAPHFHEGVGHAVYDQWLSTLPTHQPISIYVHIPFCERLCWFCACRTQGVASLTPVQAYLDVLLAEIKMFKQRKPMGLKLARLHFGGGSPTILSPDMIKQLTDTIFDAIDCDQDFEFSVEIDPTACDTSKIEAFKAAGMTRASIGVQDFNPHVQAAIGRLQSFEITKETIDVLRNSGIRSINIDMVYGLPLQDLAALKNTARKVIDLAPDRVALFGYAHVPWMAKRQKMIKDADLPNPFQRFEQSQTAAEMFSENGFKPIGIDHFAKATDSLSVAAKTGKLRRNFQGYTTDVCQSLIGFGASSISRFPLGYVQNNAATVNYTKSINSKLWAAARGIELTAEDQLRSRAIEMLMCDFKVDFIALATEFGGLSNTLRPDIERCLTRFEGHVTLSEKALAINADSQALTRLIAQVFDAYAQTNTKHSHAT